MIDNRQVKVVAFDADDTLWHNETFFREAEEKFAALFENFSPAHTVTRELLATEIKNLEWYGYGIKGFMLSMVETALRITHGAIKPEVIRHILDIGTDLLQKPVNVMPDAPLVLQTLQAHYKLVLATKGDLLDQERKLRKSGLEKYFHHIEIMSDKKEADYQKLLRHLDIRPAELLMVGNSVKSDVLPVLALGGQAIHIPYHITWAHEHAEPVIDQAGFVKAEKIRDLLPWL
ncbi:MAG: HAD family hydrolase [Cyclobacteriaceae bacterium]|jgi:putative hydrolase of the HAD superfamily|nr:HAD family hydrolase [Cyclobacteriaceae bacterium]